MSAAASTANLGYSDFLAANRGGNLFTYHINQRMAAPMAVLSYKLGWAPTILTLINLVLSIATAAWVIALTPAAASGDVSWWLVAVPAAIGWQLAYSLDCADGQLARATGTGSAVGARVDILCDVVSQTGFVASVAIVAATYSPGIPAWFIAGFAALWMVNLVTSTLQKGDSGGSVIASKNLVVEVIKLVRDTGVIVLAMPVILVVQPMWMVWFMVAFAAFNGLFLAAAIATSARDALRT